MLSLIPKFALWPFVRPVLSNGLTAIAVGVGGYIARTIDGTVWTEPASGVTVSLHQAAYNGSTWMIVGASSTVLLSTDDGVTWAPVTLPADIASAISSTSTSIVNDNGRFVIIPYTGSTGYIAYTADNGKTWVKQAQSFSLPGYRLGKARRFALDGGVYQPGGGSGGNGLLVLKWNGTSYDITSPNVSAAGSYYVQGSITETKEYFVTLQQGNTSLRRKPADTAWAITRGPSQSNAMLGGGSAIDATTDTVWQVGNADVGSGAPMMYKGVAGTAWSTIDASTMFGASQLLTDIGIASSISIIVGDTKIFYSKDLATWKPVYTAPKVINTVTMRSRSLILGDIQRWRHFSFATNEAIDDVTEKFGVLTGAPTFAANKMTTTAASQFLRLKDAVLFAANEDFTYTMTITPTATLSAAAITTDVFIAGNNDATGAFYILYGKNFNKFLIYVKIAGAFVGMVPTEAATVAAGADMNIEFSRKAGVFYLALNGVQQTMTQPSAAAIGGPQAANIVGLGIGSLNAASPFRGSIRGVYLDKGICRHIANFVPDTTLQTYVRPLYSADDAKTIRTQIGFRRDAVLDEASDRALLTPGGLNQVVQQGRMKFAGTQSSANSLQFLTDPFGTGDFTIECCFNTSVVGATAGFLLLSEWWLGSATNDQNRWALLIDSGRKAYFQMNRTTVGTDAATVYSTVALALNTDYKVIVERVSGVLNLYVLDAYTGAQIDKQTTPCTFPIRGAAPHWVRNYSPGTSNYSGTGTIWDIRIADKAMYNGAVGIAATLPGLPVNVYTTAEEANIAVQAAFSRSPRDDKTGRIVNVESAAGSVINGRLTFASSSVSAFSWPVLTPNFGAGDFTIELRVLPGTSGISGNPVSILGQFVSTSPKCSWGFQFIDGVIAAVFSPTGSGTVGLVTLKDTTAYVPGQEYYAVVERVGSTVTLYIDGVAKASATLTGSLFTSDISIMRGNLGTCAATIRDVRCSSISQYKGVVPVFPQYKRFATIKPSFTMGYYGGSTGTIYGYMENSDYSSGFIGLGSCTHKLFRYVSGSTTIVRRLKGLFMDRGSYLILGWEDTTLTPTTDMPLWTSTLSINGVNFINNSQPVSAFATPQGGTSCYWSSVTAMNPLAEGREIAFEFL